MSLKRHDPPGFTEDLLEANRQGWSDLISSFMLTGNVSPSLTPQFYDQVKVVAKNPIAPQKVTWIGFPKQVKLDHPNNQDRWKVADTRRDLQDEYLEWSIKRNNNGKMVKIVFCNEGPEYFDYLSQVQPDTLLKLYQDLHPGAPIVKSDLFTSSGQYIPENKWNSSTKTGTIMHLIQPNNTLGAEIDLAARATVIRKGPDGKVITDADRLINCSQYGSPNRNSDPTIGAGINTLSRTGLMVTVQNPIGLYIESIDLSDVEPPVGHEDDDVNKFWKWTRGKKGNYMRGEFEVPSELGYTLGDLKVKGLPLQYGGQLADLITISITAQAAPFSKPVIARFCSEPPLFASASHAANVSGRFARRR